MVRSTGILESIPTATSDTAPKKRNWTLSEDALLTKLMQQHRDSSDKSGSKSGQTDWVSIAQQFAHRNSKDCRKRWNSSLCPLISRGSWTPAEDKLLQQGMQIHMGQWAKIARHVGSRTGDQCSSRWRVLSSGADWNEERDRILLDFVNQHGKRWAQVRRLWLPMFTNAECRNRYHRIIRRLSADKRHKTEIETLERVCKGETLGASLSLLDKAPPTNAHSWRPAPVLASRTTSTTSTTTSSSSSSGSSSSSSSSSNMSRGGSCDHDERALAAAEPGRALNQARRSTNAAMESLVQQIMTDGTARDKLMQLAFTIVSCMSPDDDEPPASHAEVHDDAPQPARVEAQESEPATLAEVEDSTMHDVGDAAVQGVSNAGVLDAVLDSGMSEVDKQAWADVVLGLSEYGSMSTAASQLTIVPPEPALQPTEVVEGVPVLNEASCSRCGFKSCVCSWADLCLLDKWMSTDAHRLGSLNGLCGLSDTSSISGITSPTIRTLLDPASPSTMRSSSDASSLDSNWWM